MAEKPKITPAQLMQMAKLLKGKQVRKEADALEQLAQKGLDEDQQAQLHEVMRDKARLREMLASPQAQELMKKLGSKPGEGNSEG